MGRNIKKILKVLDKKGGVLFGTASGSWFPKGTELPSPAVESQLNYLSVSIFNCTCNTYTVQKMVDLGYLESTGTEGEWAMTTRARDYLMEREVV